MCIVAITKEKSMLPDAISGCKLLSGGDANLPANHLLELLLDHPAMMAQIHISTSKMESHGSCAAQWWMHLHKSIQPMFLSDTI